MDEIAHILIIVGNGDVATLYIHVTLGEEETQESAIVRIECEHIGNARMVTIRCKRVNMSRNNVIHL